MDLEFFSTLREGGGMGNFLENIDFDTIRTTYFNGVLAQKLNKHKTTSPSFIFILLRKKNISLYLPKVQRVYCDSYLR